MEHNDGRSRPWASNRDLCLVVSEMGLPTIYPNAPAMMVIAALTPAPEPGSCGSTQRPHRLVRLRAICVSQNNVGASTWPRGSRSQGGRQRGPPIRAVPGR